MRHRRNENKHSQNLDTSSFKKSWSVHVASKRSDTEAGREVQVSWGCFHEWRKRRQRLDTTTGKTSALMRALYNTAQSWQRCFELSCSSIQRCPAQCILWLELLYGAGLVVDLATQLPVEVVLISQESATKDVKLFGLYNSVVMKREMSKKAKLSIFKTVFVPILTYGHESGVITKRVQS